MDKASIKQQKEELIKKYGPWTGHNIQLKDDLYTIDNKIIGDEIKLKRVLQIISDNVKKPMSELRILDLACLEGLYAVELARQGAQAVGIEGREANIKKALFVKDVLSLNKLEFFQDDVRNLSKEKYGSFDVVLCLGILYHLDAPDVFTFLKSIADVCQGITIIDTHISLSAKKSAQHKNNTYWGKSFREHSPRSSLEKRKKDLWASLDNPRSFWPTQASLNNILADAGFTSVYECLNPVELKKPADRITLMATKGREQELITTPLVNKLPAQRWSEKRGIKSWFHLT